LEEAITLAAAEREALDAKKEDKKAAAKKKSDISKECRHGFIVTPDLLLIMDFMKLHLSVCFHLGEGATIFETLVFAHIVTKGKYPQVWNDPAKLELVKSYVFNTATAFVLDGDVDSAREDAAFASFLQEYISVELRKTKATCDEGKAFELYCADENTLVKYLRKNIPCSCLDEKYKQVKTITKMGVCRNPQCSLPDMTVERKKMLYCTRCRKVNYCSPECQEADWPQHKKRCNKDVEKRASFNSREHS
jgi:hypothetical protein